MGIVSRSLNKHYSAKCLTEANIFCVVTYFLAFSVPFYLSFSTENFWLKPLTEPLSITHSYSGDYIVTLGLKDSSGLTSVQTISNIASLTFTAPTSSKSVIGVSKGQKHDFTMSFTPTTGKILDNIELIVFFNTRISSLNRLDYTSALINLRGLSKSSVYNALGSISFSARSPISYISSSNTKQNLPPYFSDFTYVSDTKTIKRNIYNGDYMLNTQIISSLGNDLNATSTTLTVNLQLVSSKLADITYYPGFLRTLKIAFSQYISLFIIAFVSAANLLKCLAQSNTFPLQETSDLSEIQESIRKKK